MVSKRYSRGFRQVDSDTHHDSPARRDHVFGQPRLPLIAAAFLVFVAGTFVGTRVGHHSTGDSLAASDRFPSTQSDGDLFPETHAQASDATEEPNTNLEQASTNQANLAASTKPDRTAQRPGAEAQATAQQQIDSAEEEPAASSAASAEVKGNSWRSALREQLTAASGILTSSLHSASGDAADSGTDNQAAGSSDTQKRQSGRHRTKRKTPQAQVVPKSFPWDAKMVERTICNDSCHKARDGKCDDGSTLEEDMVFCDLGTDCHDCGNWTVEIPAYDADQDSLPIEFLHSRQIDVYVKNTTSVPSFQMAYTDYIKDVDVSAQMEHNGVVEIGLTQMWFLALKDHCIQPDGTRALVLDVGANFGWYSIYAAKLGCRVIAWEPVPQFRAFLAYNRRLNHFEDLIEIRDTAVVEVGGRLYNLTVPQRGIWGTAGIEGLNIDRNIDNHGDYEVVQALGERVDTVVKEDVLLLKVDVEGLEPAVLHSATRLLDKFLVNHIVMEYSPGPWERNFRWSEYSDLAQMLVNLQHRSYTILHVPDGLARKPLLQLPTWAGSLDPFEQVTRENMQHDLADARLLQAGKLGCPKPQELLDLNQQWGACNSIPEDLHPKSFRAAFGHNTNIWLMQGQGPFQVGPPVGVMGLEQDVQDWYGQQPLMLGMAYRHCDRLEPSVQVRHRCTCTNATVCGAEAQMVESLALQGSMLPFDS